MPLNPLNTVVSCDVFYDVKFGAVLFVCDKFECLFSGNFKAEVVEELDGSECNFLTQLIPCIVVMLLILININVKKTAVLTLV